MAANSLTLSWSASTGTAPITYQPLFRLTGGSTFLSFGSPVSGLSVVVTGLVASTGYDFEVTAINGFGSTTSALVSGATSSGNAFPAPGNVAGNQNTGSTAPIITGPQNGAAFLNTALAVIGVTITDVAATTGTLVVNCTSGSLGMRLNGQPVANTLTDTFANVKAALASLIYTAPGGATIDTISIKFTDQASSNNTLLIQIQDVAQGVAVAPNAPTNLVATVGVSNTMQLAWAASTTGTAPILYQPLYRLHTAGAQPGGWLATANVQVNGSTISLSALATGSGDYPFYGNTQLLQSSYWELLIVTPTSTTGFSAGLAPLGGSIANAGPVLRWYEDGSLWSDGGYQNLGGAGTWPPYASGDLICLAFDAVHNTLYGRKGASGQWNNSGTANPATNTGGLAVPASILTAGVVVGGTLYQANNTVTANFTTATFVGTPPSGFAAIVGVGGAPVFIASGPPVSGLVATISGLLASTSYDFEITASNSAGSATSTVVTASTSTTTAVPSAPTNLQAQSATNTTLTVSWSPSATGSSPITYQPQIRPTGATVTTLWYESPGQDGGFWRQPFYSTANWITTGALVTALRNGAHGTPTGTVNLAGNYSVPWYVGRPTDPLVTVTDGTRTISVRMPLGATIETPTSAFDQSVGGADSTTPYRVWSISGATMNTGTVQASGSVITGTYGMTIQDGSGLMMEDIITGIPGSNNSIGNVQDLELTRLNADPNYVIPHMLTFQLDQSTQISSAGPIWPLALVDLSGPNTGTIPQGITIGIPASTPRPTGKTRGFYAWWDLLQQYGAFEYNDGAVGGVNFMIYSTLGANAALVTDMVNSLSAVMASVCILNYANGVSGAQYSAATVKGFTPGAVSAFPPPPILDLSQTGGRTIQPSSFGAWYNSTTGYNVTPPIPTGGASGPFVNFGSPISGTSVTFTGLSPNTSYDIDIIAINSLGQATSAAITSSTGIVGIPSDPSGTQARPAQDMLNRFGINTHFGNGLYAAFTPAQAVAAIQSIGVTLIRDSENG